MFYGRDGIVPCKHCHRQTRTDQRLYLLEVSSTARWRRKKIWEYNLTIFERREGWKEHQDTLLSKNKTPKSNESSTDQRHRIRKARGNHLIIIPMNVLCTSQSSNSGSSSDPIGNRHQFGSV